MAKMCKKCLVNYPLEMFSKNKKCKEGVTNTCRPCANSYIKSLRELGKCLNNPEKHRKVCEKYRNRNPEAFKATQDKHRKTKLGYYAYKSSEYRASKLLATASWGDSNYIKDLYENAKEAFMVLGIHFEIDHIIPLQGMDVCGLHVPDNLQVLTRHDNRSKGIKYE